MNSRNWWNPLNWLPRRKVGWEDLDQSFQGSHNLALSRIKTLERKFDRLAAAENLSQVRKAAKGTGQ